MILFVLIQRVRLFLIFFITTPVFAQVELIKDINKSKINISSGVDNQTVVGDKLFFTAQFEKGIELYISDGTKEGTVMVKDINPGNNSSDPRRLTNVNGILFFVANTKDTGYELWKSDGTENGTELVKETSEGPGYLGTIDLTSVGNNLYFNVTNSNNTYSLWISDGTEDGTVFLKQFSERPRNLVEHQGLLTFNVEGSLWKSDGTSDGTTMIFKPDASNWFGISMSVNEILYFTTGGSNINEQLLWALNENNEVELIANIPTRFIIQEYSNLDNEFYFVITNLNSSLKSIWRTVNRKDGIEKVVNEISSFQIPLELTKSGNNLYFSGHLTNLGGSVGQELWKIDNNSDEAMLVNDFGGDSRPQNLMDHNGQLYFVLESLDGYRKVYRSDGTLNGTAAVMDNNGDFWIPNDLYSTGSHLYFISNNGALSETELYVFNGSPEGENLTFIDGSYGSRPNDFTLIDEVVYFRAKSSGVTSGSSQLGFNVWKTDGSTEGTIPLSDLVTDHNIGYARTITPHKLELYIENTDGELWKTDGTNEGTIKLASFEFGFSLYNLTSAGDFLYFPDASNTSNIGLWKTDGTLNGTNKIVDLPNSVLHTDFIQSSDRIFFALYNEEKGLELWASNGEIQGTGIVKDIVPGGGSSFPEQLVDLDGVLYFVADDQQHGEELWRSDGTEDGTYMVIDLEEGSNSSTIRNLTAANGKLYFEASPFLKSDGLWTSDGTAEGTSFVHSLDRPSIGARPTHFTEVGDLVYFASNSSFTFTQGVWKTNGTPEGTQRIGDLEGLIYAMRENNGQLFFTLTTNHSDHSLWKVDHSQNQPELVTYFGPYFDRAGYPGSSPIEDLYTYQDGFLIPGATNTLGSELWKFTYVNEQNVIINDELNIDENSAPGTVISTLDIDESINPIAFQIEPLGDFHDVFEIDDTGNLYVNNSELLDHENNPAIELRVLIRVDGDVIHDNILVNINNVNEQPSIVVGQNFSLPVGSENGYQLGVINGNDPEDDNLIFELFSSDPEGIFSVSTNGKLSLSNASALHEVDNQDFVLNIRISDGSLESIGNVYVSLLISVIEGGDFEVDENVANGTVIGRLLDENQFEGWELSIRSGNESAAFEIQDNSDLVVKDNSILDYEVNQSFNLLIIASNGTESDTASYSINIKDINEAPTIANKTIAAPENLPLNTVLGDTEASDVDTENLTYSIVSGNAGQNYALADTGTILVNNAAYFDFETFTRDTLNIRVFDGEFADTARFIIRLTNVNESLTISDSTYTIDENSANNVTVGSLKAEDIDGDALTFNIVSGNTGDAFALSGKVIVVNNTEQLDFETTPVFNLQVSATDGEFTETAAITIELNDIFELVNDKPQFFPQTFSINENQPKNTQIGTLEATDTVILVNGEPTLRNNEITYKIVNQSFPNAVALDTLTGVLTINDSAAFDYEGSSFGNFPTIVVNVRVSDGHLSTTAPVTIQIFNVEEPPYIEDQVFSIPENSPAGTLVDKVKAIDGDGAGLSLRIISGNLNSAFFMSNAGTLTVQNPTPLNFEVNPQLVLVVEATDQVDTVTANITINVTDVNDPPKLTGKLFDIDENPAKGDTVGNINVIDDDGLENVIFTILEGNVQGAFIITEDGFIIVENEDAIDFEELRTITLRVLIEDGIFTFEEIVDIQINDVIDNLLITDVEDEIQVKFYPNPVRDRLIVELPGLNDERILISDLSGKILWQSFTNRKALLEINTTSYRPGIYLLMVGQEVFKFRKE